MNNIFRLLIKFRNKLFGIDHLVDLLMQNSQRQNEEAAALESQRITELEQNISRDFSLIKEQFAQQIMSNMGNIQQNLSSNIHEIKNNLPNSKFNSPDMNFWSIISTNLSSADFFIENLIDKPTFENSFDLLSHCISLLKTENMVLEFGVFEGRTINFIAGLKPESIIHGFDSFEGLPETWRAGFEKGAFSLTSLPEVMKNVRLHKGWFNQSLPKFLEENPGNIEFVHIDCDLYSSTKYVLDALNNQLSDETIIVFDEFFNYPGWKHHEFKAFEEFANQYNWDYQFLGSVPTNQQVAVQISRV